MIFHETSQYYSVISMRVFRFSIIKSNLICLFTVSVTSSHRRVVNRFPSDKASVFFTDFHKPGNLETKILKFRLIHFNAPQAKKNSIVVYKTLVIVFGQFLNGFSTENCKKVPDFSGFGPGNFLSPDRKPGNFRV